MPDLVDVSSILVQVDAVDDVFLRMEVGHVHVIPQLSSVHDYTFTSSLSFALTIEAGGLRLFYMYGLIGGRKKVAHTHNGS